MSKYKIKRKYIMTTNYGMCKITERVGKDKHGHSLCRIIFINTGSIQIVRLTDLRRNNVKDLLVPSVLSIGYLGSDFNDIKNSIYHNNAIHRWRDMINRCYSNKLSQYKHVTVSNEWLNYSVFFHDIFNLTGFDKDEFICGNLSLDKDKLQPGIINKQYSKDTCIWMTMIDQMKYRDLSALMKTFIAISPDGISREYTNTGEFARTHNLNHKNISQCLSGEKKTHRGWEFKPIEKCNDYRKL